MTMAAPAQQLKRPPKHYCKARYCIPLFLLSCVAINTALVVLWLSKQDNHSNNATHGVVVVGAPSFETPVMVGHVVSLIQCGKVASVTGFLDAAAVLRHSIHSQPSRYGYEMYAIVHTDCQHHAPLLQRMGYTPLVRDSPVLVQDIKDGWYKDHVEGENCCGSREFIKLYAYELEQHPVVVHWDLDVALLQPMDDLFDAILYSKESQRGKQARQRLDVQFPSRPLPERIDAFFTRDVTSSVPWEPVQVVQGGFLVARPNKEDLQTYIDFIKEANYVKGRGAGSGWNAMGYGGFQGAMAYQGAVAYFYDFYRNNTAVELNACLWNQVVADVIWRGPERKDEYHGKCRQFQQHDDCQDCRVTPVELVKSVHYTACKKPWECTLPHPRKTRNPAQQYRVDNLTNITTCGKLFAKWFEYRREFEQRLQETAGVTPSVSDGTYEPESFLGYCKGRGNYIPMVPPPRDFNISKLYSSSER